MDARSAWCSDVGNSSPHSKTNNRWLGMANAMAAGMMLTASGTLAYEGWFPEGIVEPRLHWGLSDPARLGLGLLAGIVFILFIKRVIDADEVGALFLYTMESGLYDELNRLLEGLNNGEGTIGALLQDDTLHRGLLATNKEVQNLINDLYLNPQRYVRVSVFGRKENRRMSEKELERLQRLIQSELDNRAEDAE